MFQSTLIIQLLHSFTCSTSYTSPTNLGPPSFLHQPKKKEKKKHIQKPHHPKKKRMKGYSKIKGNHSFIPRSKSNKEFLFLDKDFELLSSKALNKKPQIHEHEEPRVIHEDYHKKNDNFLGKTEDFDADRSERSKGGVLKRNFSVSSSAKSSYQKNNNNNSNKVIGLERQSSTRAIQEAVKRAFSIKRSSSVNSDRYSRIHDQSISMSSDDYDHNCDYVYDHSNDADANHTHQDYDFERLGSSETRSMSMMKKNQDYNNGRRHVGSKVVRACKRLFSR